MVYFKEVPEKFSCIENQLWIVPVYHIFGSEELSAKSSSVAKRVTKPYLMINADDAAKLKIQENQEFDFNIEEQAYRLPVKISAVIPKGISGLPIGLPGLPFVDFPAWGII